MKIFLLVLLALVLGAAALVGISCCILSSKISREEERKKLED